MKAFRFTISREYRGVIVARSEPEARAALVDGVVSEIDCLTGPRELSVDAARFDDVTRAARHDVLFDMKGGAALVDDVTFDDDEEEPTC